VSQYLPVISEAKKNVCISSNFLGFLLYAIIFSKTSVSKTGRLEVTFHIESGLRRVLSLISS
jgi:hypothetical protein